MIEMLDSGMLTRVVCLTEATEQTSCGCRVDDSAVLLLSEMRPRCSGTLVCTPDVNLHDQVPVVVLHVLEADVSEDSSIVDQDVDSAKSLDGRVDDLFTIFDRVVVGNGLASSCLDLLDHDVCCLFRVR
jgi:hypothetical protein